MIATLVLIQLVVPLALVVAHALLPSASLPGVLIRTAAIGLAIWLIALGGIWLFPPWWTPYAYLLLLAAATLYRFRLLRLRPSSGRLFRWGEIAVGAVLAAVALVALAPLVAGRTTPAGAVDLAFPLGAGAYLVVSGGADVNLNAHLNTLADNERFRPWVGQSYGVDLVAIDGWGLRATGIAPADPAAYAIFGRDVLAPCDGTVAAVHDGVPDLPVPQKDRVNLAGNFVLIDCGAHLVALAHFQQGTIRAAAGDVVTTGMVLGAVGNSGNSDEPHLHIHVQRGTTAEAPMSGEPVPLTLDGRFPVRNDRFSR